MSEMNCQRATELMPLYAAGDLESTRGRKVVAHLAACDDCRALAAEFAESRSLLAEACELPEFGADFYAGIRSVVLDEISRARTPSTPSSFIASPSSFIASLFGRRLIYAASLALLLVACGLALYHFRGGANESPQDMAKDRHEKREQSHPRQADMPSPPPRIENQENAPLTVLANESPRKRRRVFFEPAAVNRTVASRQTDFTQSESMQVASMPGATAAVGSTNAASQPAPEVSRIEIQTADPNIRIIWLAPQKPEAPKPERDKNENGDTK
jgi:anti-sigma factor RsiW